MDRDYVPAIGTKRNAEPEIEDGNSSGNINTDYSNSISAKKKKSKEQKREKEKRDKKRKHKDKKHAQELENCKTKSILNKLIEDALLPKSIQLVQTQTSTSLISQIHNPLSTGVEKGRNLDTKAGKGWARVNGKRVSVDPSSKHQITLLEAIVQDENASCRD